MTKEPQTATAGELLTTDYKCLTENNYPVLKAKVENEFKVAQFSIVPLVGKKPYCNKWTTLECVDLEIQFKKGNNVGIRTGERSGITVVDIDKKDGGLETWKMIENLVVDGGDEPWIVQTGSGGFHHYYEYDADFKNGDNRCIIVDGKKVGIDLKNDKGQVVAPGSIHPDTKATYVEVNGTIIEYLNDGGGHFCKMPSKLKSLLLQKTEIKEGQIVERVQQKRADNVAQPEVENEYEALMNLPPPEGDVSIEKLRQTLRLLKPDRANGRGDWINVIWALQNIGELHNLETLPLAHEFSEQCKDKYEKTVVDTLFRTAPRCETGFKFGSMIKWAREDSPTECAKLELTWKPIPEALTENDDDFKLIAAGNDEDLAKVFAKHNREDIKIVDDSDHAFIWDEKRLLWVRTALIHVENRIASFLLPLISQAIKETKEPSTFKSLQKTYKRAASTTGGSAIFRKLRSLLHAPTKWVHCLDTNSRLLPLQRGEVVNLQTGEVRPRTRDDMFTQECGTYMPKERNPANYNKLMNSLFPIKDDADCMKRILGLCLTGETDRSIFIWYGEGANGKSALCIIMEHILGLDFLFTPIQKAIFIKNHREIKNASGHTAHIMPLIKKRMAVCQESDRGDVLDASSIKALSASDTISGRAPFGKEMISFTNHATLIKCTQYKPIFDTDDQAVIDRLVYINFSQRFVVNPRPNTNERPRDTAFIELMKNNADELSQVLACLVDGAVDYFKNGMQYPESILSLKQANIMELDHIGNFLDNYCEKGADFRVQAKDLYSAYMSTVDDSGKMTDTEFGLKLAARKLTKKRMTHGNFYIGFQLIPEPNKQVEDMLKYT